MNPHQILTESDIIFNAHEVDLALLKLAQSISADYQSSQPLVLAVMGGAV